MKILFVRNFVTSTSPFTSKSIPYEYHRSCIAPIPIQNVRSEYAVPCTRYNAKIHRTADLQHYRAPNRSTTHSDRTCQATGAIWQRNTIIITMIVVVFVAVVTRYIEGNGRGEIRDCSTAARGKDRCEDLRAHLPPTKAAKKMTRRFNRASFHLSSLFIGNFRLRRRPRGRSIAIVSGRAAPPPLRSDFSSRRPHLAPRHPILHPYRSTKVKHNAVMDDGQETLPLHATRDTSYLQWLVDDELSGKRRKEFANIPKNIAKSSNATFQRAFNVYFFVTVRLKSGKFIFIIIHRLRGMWLEIFSHNRSISVYRIFWSTPNSWYLNYRYSIRTDRMVRARTDFL